MIKAEYDWSAIVDAIFAMEARLAAMIEHKMGNMTSTSSSKSNQMIMFCDFCSGEHPNHECPSMEGLMEQVDFVQRNQLERKRKPSAKQHHLPRIVGQPTIDIRCRGWPGSLNPRPTIDGRPHPTVGCREKRVFPLRETSPKYDKKLKKPKAKEKHLFPKMKASVMKWVSVRHIEEEKPKKHPDFRDYRATGQKPTVDGRLDLPPTVDLIREFYANMIHKMEKDLETIISTIKGVRIILDRERLASILGIQNEENSTAMDLNRKTMDEDMDWSCEATCVHFGNWLRPVDRRRILHEASLEGHSLPRCNSLLEDSFDGCFGEFEGYKHTIAGLDLPCAVGQIPPVLSWPEPYHKVDLPSVDLLIALQFLALSGSYHILYRFFDIQMMCNTGGDITKTRVYRYLVILFRAFAAFNKTTQTGLGASSSQPTGDENEEEDSSGEDDSYDPSEADAPVSASIAAF
ncbi:hypothetical protein M9H77_02511 [Catharanthus roseus]|uniref:Uncharacterized protein n=1 Tax=Catharanthus roseus TaxID=4058 RepID=A0ACC0C917_CATRO|nr:hypothetical protein M9H77_02511 [Catharanthus roseus]